MTERVKNYLQEHFPDYDEKSVFACADGITYIFSCKNDKQSKVLYIDRETNEIKMAN